MRSHEYYNRAALHDILELSARNCGTLFSADFDHYAARPSVSMSGQHQAETPPVDASEAKRNETSGAGTLLDWRPPVLVDRGSGTKGPWRMNESVFHYVDDPTVAWSKD